MSKKHISNTNCCVYGCHSKKGKNVSLSFHKFPPKNQSFVSIENKFGVKQKVDKYKAWMLVLKMGKPPYNRATVCSVHFSKNDFILPDCPSQKRRLKSTAVPSLNLPVSSHQSSTSKRRQERFKRLRETGSDSDPEPHQSLDLSETRVEDFNIENYTRVSKIADYITPVPGGVGPMTVAMLMCNTFKAAKILATIKEENA